MASLTDRRFLAAKAAISAVLAWTWVDLLGNPDAVSASFVAVICTSPIILSGLKRARDQVLGSIIGGALAVVFALSGLPTALALAAAVSSAVWVTIAAGLEAGYLVAAFTAIYLLLVPRGTPWDTLLVRLSAVTVGAGAAVLVNGVVSLLMYARIFRRKVQVARQQLHQELLRIGGSSEPPADGIDGVFVTLRSLQEELRDAQRELDWRKGSALRFEVAEQARFVHRLADVAHHARDALLLVRSQGRGWTWQERDALAGLAAEFAQGQTFTGEIPASLARLAAAVRK